jgi:capsular exopolysaccharide synthesis family protein
MTERTEMDQIFREDPVDFKKHLNTVYRKRWVLVSIMSVMMMITLIRTLTETPKYKATAIMLMDTIGPNSAPIITREGIKVGTGSDEYISTQQNLIKSAMMAKRVRESLQINIPELVLIDMVNVEQVKKSRIVNLSVTYKDSVMAAKIANAYSQAYIDQNVENMLFMSKEVLRALPGGERKKIENSTIYGQLKELNNEDAIDALPSVMADTTIQGLKSQKLQLEQEIDNVSKKYKEKHPKMISLKTKLTFANDNLKAQKSRVLTMIKADLAGRLQINNVRIIDAAVPPRKPISPNMPRDILSGLILSVFIGLSALFFLESLDDSVKNKRDVEEDVGIPYLGEFPLMKGTGFASGKTSKFENLEKDPEAAEAIRNIRTNVIFSMPKEALNTILITSTIPQEGKSFLASYLAYSFAKNGIKTLIIDGDIRKPTINKIFGIDRSPGLTNLLVENISADEIIYKTQYANLYVLPCGSKSPNPLELLDAERLGDIIKELSKKFGKIIIDTPPSLALSDAVVLSKISDGIIFTVKSGFISKDVLKKVRDKFLITNSKILGVMMNFFELKEHSYYKDKYYHKYYKNYYRAHSEEDKDLVTVEDPKSA